MGRSSLGGPGQETGCRSWCGMQGGMGSAWQRIRISQLEATRCNAASGGCDFMQRVAAGRRCCIGRGCSIVYFLPMQYLNIGFLEVAGASVLQSPGWPCNTGDAPCCGIRFVELRDYDFWSIELQNYDFLIGLRGVRRWWDWAGGNS